MENFPSREETEFGERDYEAIRNSVQKETTKEKRKNSKFTDEERYEIGKYAAIYGASAAAKKFGRSKKFNFGESTARLFKKRYQEQIRKKKTTEIERKITTSKRGRPLMLGPIDEKVQSFLHVLRRKGGVVNTVVAIATAKALIARSDEEHLKCIDIDKTSWAKSLFRRMGFKKRTCTTSKPEIPELAKKEAKLIFQHQIVDHVERHSIPPSLIMNFDQTPLKFAPVSSQTLAKKGSKHVAVSGQAFKKAITATFGITFSMDFLPMQLIYGGKTERSLPKVKFPESFSLSVNEKHFSNTQESLKLIDEIIVPYVEKEREKLELPKDQPALLIIDVFSGQMTQPVLTKLKENHIKLTKVPANMTNLFQPLDLTVNGSAKAFMKRKFTEWYSSQISKQLDEGKPIEDINVEMKLSVLKPLHAEWINELYNYLTSADGREIISNGWKSACITEALLKGKKGLEPLDPFFEIDPLLDDDDGTEINRETQTNTDEVQFFVTRMEDESDSEDDWEYDGEEVRNIFEFLDDENEEE